MITLKFLTVDGIGFDGLAYYANVDTPFDADDYAEHAGISRAEIDADSIKAANDAASQEGPDSWLKIYHA